jgi:hydrogenase maturation protease
MILIAGIGNIFLGDDAFGVEVALALQRRPLPGGVAVKDFGIRGFDLAYTLLDPWDAVILVDAMPRGENPGTLYIVEPNLAGISSANASMDPHSVDPVRVLTLAVSFGTITTRVFVVGCEPHDFGDEFDGRMGLSAPVQAAVEEACNMVLELINRIQVHNVEMPEQKLCPV